GIPAATHVEHERAEVTASAQARREHLRRRVAADAGEPRVADDTDDLGRSALVVGGKRLDALTDGVHPEIEPVEKGLVDDDDCCARLAVRIGEPAPCQHRYRHRLEEAGSGPWISSKRPRVAFDSRARKRNDAPREPERAERRHRRGTDRDDSGLRFERVDDTRIDRVELLALVAV